MNSLEGKGEIYMLTLPNNKRYIGQAQCFKGKGKTRRNHGTSGRLREHIRSAKNNSHLIIHRAINKYGAHNVKVKTLFICPKTELNYYEVKFIRKYNTLHPAGYNLTTGGNLWNFADVVRRRIAANTPSGEKNSFYGKHFTEEMKDKMRMTLSKNPRTEHNNGLPMYVFYYKRLNKLKNSSSIKEGYEVRNHPKIKQKCFCSMKIPMEEKLQLALNHIKLCLE
jgi:group I intron endonuclease